MTCCAGDLPARARSRRRRRRIPTPRCSSDGGIRSLLESVALSQNVTYAAIVNRDGVAVAHSFKDQEGQKVPDQAICRRCWRAAHGAAADRLRRISTSRSASRCSSATRNSAPIKIGISTHPGQERAEARVPPGAAERAHRTGHFDDRGDAAGAVDAAADSRHPERPDAAGRGELDVRLDLEGDEFKDLGSSFDAVSAQLSESRAEGRCSSPTDFESVVENLEDAVALFSPGGALIFCNPAMGARAAAIRQPRTRRWTTWRRPTIRCATSWSGRSRHAAAAGPASRSGGTRRPSPDGPPD